MYKNIKNLIALGLILTASTVFAPKAYADCEPNYGGGQTCIVNKRFSIEKKVRIEGDNTFKDKVTGVEEGDVVEFQIKITNESDDEAEPFDDMKMNDILPDEMYRVGGSGLTEYFEDFESGDEKTFIIKAKIEGSEFDRSEDFEKCIVNKGEVYFEENLEGSDTATVCYGNIEVSELPETGFVSGSTLIGTALVSLGTLIKRKAR